MFHLQIRKETQIKKAKTSQRLMKKLESSKVTVIFFKQDILLKTVEHLLG